MIHLCALPTVVTEACQGRTWDGPGAEDLHGDRWHARKGNLFCGKKNMTALVKLWAWGTVRCREFCMHRKSGWMALADAGYKREQVGL